MPCPDLKSENTNVRSFRGSGNIVINPALPSLNGGA